MEAHSSPWRGEHALAMILWTSAAAWVICASLSGAKRMIVLALNHCSLTLYRRCFTSGFMELLTRIALGQQKLGARPQEALENLMHIMDASDGKAKLIRASRKSTSVRHFVYGLK